MAEYPEPTMRPASLSLLLELSAEDTYETRLHLDIGDDGVTMVNSFGEEVSLLAALDECVAMLRELDEEARRRD